MSDYQLIVIGAGPGGYTAALQAAKRASLWASIGWAVCGAGSPRRR